MRTYANALSYRFWQRAIDFHFCSNDGLTVIQPWRLKPCSIMNSPAAVFSKAA